MAKRDRRPLRDAGIWGLPKLKTVNQVDPFELAREGKFAYARRILQLQEDRDGLERLLSQAMEEGNYFAAVATDKAILQLTGSGSGKLTAGWHRVMGEELLAKGQPSLAIQAFEAADDPEGAQRAREALAALIDRATRAWVAWGESEDEKEPAPSS